MVEMLSQMVKSNENGQVSMHQFFIWATVNIVWQLATGQRVRRQLIRTSYAHARVKLAYNDPTLKSVIFKIYEFFKFLKPGPNSLIQLQVNIN